jgi:hypothetical protein
LHQIEITRVCSHMEGSRCQFGDVIRRSRHQKLSEIKVEGVRKPRGSETALMYLHVNTYVLILNISPW